MIYFDRIEVVNMLVTSAGTITEVPCLIPYLVQLLNLWTPQHSSSLTVAYVYYCSGGHCKELHCWLWQNSHLQQDSPWTEPILQCAYITGGLHWIVWWVHLKLEMLHPWHCFDNGIQVLKSLRKWWYEYKLALVITKYIAFTEIMSVGTTEVWMRWCQHWKKLLGWIQWTVGNSNLNIHEMKYLPCNVYSNFTHRLIITKNSQVNV